jgi:uracil-DNA glycosylase family 4
VNAEAGRLPEGLVQSFLAFGVDHLHLPQRAPEGAAPTGEAPAGLEALAREIEGCRRCSLGSSRQRAVPGQGHSSPRLVFVGEAPGVQEDRSGLPFVGPAGQLLNRMIGAMGLQREAVFIANVLKCHPPGNRPPSPEEALACTPFLWRQLELLRPELVIALGAHAARNLLGSDLSIRRLRGRVHDARGFPCIVTYHPSYLLQHPEWKRDAWADLQLAMRRLGLAAPGAA